MESKIELFIAHLFVMVYMAIQRFSPFYNLFFY